MIQLFNYLIILFKRVYVENALLNISEIILRNNTLPSKREKKRKSNDDIKLNLQISQFRPSNPGGQSHFSGRTQLPCPQPPLQIAFNCNLKHIRVR